MYKNIMVPLDGSELAECVFSHVEAIAKATKAAVELVHVVGPIELPSRGGIALSVDDLKQIELHAKRDAENYLEGVASRLKRSNIKVKSKIIVGKAAESLSDYAQSGKFDLIIMATHGRSGISRWWVGSIADRILHASSIPVLLVRAPGYTPAS